MLRYNSATLLRGALRRGVNGPENVAFERRFYAESALSVVNSQENLPTVTRPRLSLIPRILNQSELPSLHNARRFSE